MKIIHFHSFPYVPASHEDPKNPGVVKKVLLKYTDLVKGRIQMINWAKLGPRKSFRTHYHEDMEEIFIILTGKAKLSIDKEDVMLQKRDTVIIGVGKVHTMINVGDTAVEYIAIGITPKGNGKTIVV